MCRRRDLVEELAKPQWWVDRKGEVPEGKSDAFQLRVFHYFKARRALLSIPLAATPTRITPGPQPEGRPGGVPGASRKGYFYKS